MKKFSKKDIKEMEWIAGKPKPLPTVPPKPCPKPAEYEGPPSPQTIDNMAYARQLYKDLERGPQDVTYQAGKAMEDICRFVIDAEALDDPVDREKARALLWSHLEWFMCNLGFLRDEAKITGGKGGGRGRRS